MTQKEIKKLKTMETARVVMDTLVYDMGEDQEPRFLFIVDDTGNTDFVNDKGESSVFARTMIAQAMQTQAYMQGATKIPASACIDVGGLPDEIVNSITNDVVYAFNGGSTLYLSNPVLDKYTLENKLLIRNKDMLVTAPFTTELKLDGKFREPIEALIPLIVEEIIDLINTRFKFMRTYTALIKSLIEMYGGVNNISKKYLDRMFTEVTAGLVK